MKYLSLWVVLVALICVGCSADVPVPETTIPGSQGPKTKVIEDWLAGKHIVVAGSKARNVVVAFERELNGVLLDFQGVGGGFPVIMTDASGTSWDIWGRAVDGPLAGSQLRPLNAGVGYWFVFSASYPGLELHGEAGIDAPLAWDTLPGWGVPEAGVAQGADFNEIEALDDPQFIQYHPFEISPDDGFYLTDEDLIVVVRINGETKVYPHAILNWHEIINDEVGGVPVAVTYSPLTGTAKVWERDSILYGVSGLIYNNNMLAFDRFTESFWWQLEGRCVFGGLRGASLPLRHSVETTWGTWIRVDPSPVVVSDLQGSGYAYRDFPYGDYPTNEHITYPLLFQDNRLPPKERVFAIIAGGICKVYPLSDF